MIDRLQRAKDFLWVFVEIGFLAVLAVILIYLLMGEHSGALVAGIASNVIKFVAAIPPQSEVGLALVLALIFLIVRRRR